MSVRPGTRKLSSGWEGRGGDADKSDALRTLTGSSLCESINV